VSGAPLVRHSAMDFRPNIQRLALALLCSFLGLLVPLTYWQVLAASRLQDSPHNQRPRVRRAAIRRGAIHDRNGRELAKTKDFGDGQIERVYPLGEAAAHVVGYSARIHGRDGIERTQDDALIASGVYRTSTKRLFSPRGVGCDVTLALDGEAQRAIYSELGMRNGAVIALHPRTGEVLMMISSPSFSPGLVDDEWESMRRRSDAPLVNRASSRRYGCGAALQLALAVAAIDSGAVQVTDTFRCRGTANVDGVRVECPSRRAHGNLSLDRALAAPCRTILATLAARIGPAALDRYIDRLGLRGTPQIELASRASVVPNLSLIGTADFIAACLGDDSVQVTPLALCSAAAGIANEGVSMRPHLVTSVSDVNGRVLDYTAPQRIASVCTSATAGQVAGLMAAVAQRVMPEPAGIPEGEVAGLAGSTMQPDDTWAPWFVGFAPATGPEVVVVVLIEDGGRSGAQAATVAGRAFQAILR